MKLLDLFGLLDSPDVHETRFVYDEIVERPSSINSVGLLELLGISQSIEEKEKLWVLVRLVNSASQCLHSLLNLAHAMLLCYGRAGIQGIAHVYD